MIFAMACPEPVEVRFNNLNAPTPDSSPLTPHSSFLTPEFSVKHTPEKAFNSAHIK